MTVVDDVCFKDIYQVLKQLKPGLDTFMNYITSIPSNISPETAMAIYRLFWHRHLLQNAHKYNGPDFVQSSYQRILQSTNENEILDLASEVNMPPCFIARIILNEFLNRHQQNDIGNVHGIDDIIDADFAVKRWLHDPFSIPNTALSKMVIKAASADDICSPASDAIKQ